MYGRVTARGIGGAISRKFGCGFQSVKNTASRRRSKPSSTIRAGQPDWHCLEYQDGEKTYIIAPSGLQVGAKLLSGPTAPPELGNCLPLRTVPVGLPIHNLELIPGRGAQMVRTAGGGR